MGAGGRRGQHPEWWPRVVEVGGDEFEREAATARSRRRPWGDEATTLEIEEIEDLDHLAIRCLDTGTYVRFLLTEAQGGTFVDSQMGMDPKGLRNRVFDTVMGERYFSSWLADTVASLSDAARRRGASG